MAGVRNQEPATHTSGHIQATYGPQEPALRTIEDLPIATVQKSGSPLAPPGSSLDSGGSNMRAYWPPVAGSDGRWTRLLRLSRDLPIFPTDRAPPLNCARPLAEVAIGATDTHHYTNRPPVVCRYPITSTARYKRPTDDAPALSSIHTSEEHWPR